jgi:hypothetical protein
VQVIKDDRTFLVTDRMGDVPEGNTAALGFYHRDTRFLSGLRLDVTGLRPILLHSSTKRNYSQIVELTYPFEAIDVDGVHRKESVSVRRFGSCRAPCSSGFGSETGGCSSTGPTSRDGSTGSRSWGSGSATPASTWCSPAGRGSPPPRSLARRATWSSLSGSEGSGF